jgi:hypothetical protein
MQLHDSRHDNAAPNTKRRRRVSDPWALIENSKGTHRAATPPKCLHEHPPSTPICSGIQSAANHTQMARICNHLQPPFVAQGPQPSKISSSWINHQWETSLLRIPQRVLVCLPHKPPTWLNIQQGYLTVMSLFTRCLCGGGGVRGGLACGEGREGACPCGHFWV